MKEQINDPKVFDRCFDQLRNFLNENSLEVHPLSSILLMDLSLSLKKKEYYKSDIISSLIQLKKEDKSDFKTFEKHLDSFYSKRQRRVHSEKIDFTILVEMDAKFGKRSLNLKGVEFTVVSKSILEQLNIQEIEFSSFVFGYKTQSYKDAIPDNLLMINVEGISLMDAWNKIEHEYSLLRAILDYSFSKDKINTAYGRSRLKFREPKVIFGQTEKTNEFHELYLSDNRQTFSTYLASDIEKKVIRKILGVFKNDYADSRIESLIESALLLYSSAMHSVKNEDYFLSLWQLLEAIFLPENGRTQDVVSRSMLMADFFSFPKDSFRSIMSFTADERNKLVHTGRCNISPEELTVLQICCNRAIEWLIDNKSNFETIDRLRQFYKHANLVKGDPRLFKKLVD